MVLMQDTREVHFSCFNGLELFNQLTKTYIFKSYFGEFWEIKPTITFADEKMLLYVILRGTDHKRQESGVYS